MDIAQFRAHAETAPDELRHKMVALPDIIADWLEAHGGLNGRKVMDFGCGRGEMAAGIAFAHPDAEVVGLEITPEPRHLGKVLEKSGFPLPPNLSFRQVKPGDLCDDGDFDVVVSWSVFEHIQRNQFNAVMGQLRDRIRPGGVVFMQVSPLYFSPEGAHMWHLGYLDWQHLTRELSEVREDLDAATNINDVQRTYLWDGLLGLNRLTAPDFEERLTGLGFSVLRRQIDHVDREPPAELLRAYDRDALTTYQVVLLLHRD